MADVFVDTAGWASFFVTTQPFHKQANTRMRRWRNEKTRVVTTNYIVAELVALLTRPLRVPRAQKAYEKPRRGDRGQPTAQAVGFGHVAAPKPRQGRKNAADLFRP